MIDWKTVRQGDAKREFDKWVWENENGDELTFELSDEVVDEYLLCIHSDDGTTIYTKYLTGFEKARAYLGHVTENPEQYGL